MLQCSTQPLERGSNNYYFIIQGTVIKMKKSVLGTRSLVSLVLVLVLAFTLSASAFALEDLGTIEESSVVSPRLVMREFVGYDSSANSRNLKYTHVGTVEGKNPTGNKATLYFYYQTSGTTSASLGSTVTTQVEIDAIIAKVNVSLGVTTSTSRSWTAGTNSGGSLELAPYTSGKISGYIPGVTTSGSLKYKAYTDSYPDNWWYEYKSVSNAYLPQIGYTYVEFG